MRSDSLKKTLFSALLLLFCISAYAQRGGNTMWKKYRHEVSVGYGINTLFATLGERDNLGFNYVLQRSTFNASYRYYVFGHMAVRGSISHGFARKNDKTLNQEDRLNVRLDYISTMSEFAAMAEYHFIDEATKGQRRSNRRARGGVSRGMKLGLSVFGGAGLSYLRPYGEYFGEEVEFKPITEPLTIPNTDRYKRLNLHFPVGGQARILVNENWRIGIEAGYRLGLREYIDNVSGVYYRDPEFIAPDPNVADPRHIGMITFADEKAPIADLASDKGKRHYLFAFITLAYRIKS